MTRTAWFVSLALVVAVLLGSSLVYGRLPDRVPTHWNSRGEVDAHGPQAVAAFAVPAVLVGLLGLFALLPRISPASFTLDEFPGDLRRNRGDRPGDAGVRPGDDAPRGARLPVRHDPGPGRAGCCWGWA